MKLQHPVTFSLIFALHACAAAPNADVDLAAEEEAVRARSAAIVAAEAAKDVETAVGFYLQDAIVLAPDQPLVRGRDAIHEMYTRMVEMPFTDFTSGPLDVEVAPSGDMAYEHGYNRLTFASAEGSWTDVGKYLLVWRKVDGEWRIAALSFSSDAPPPAAAADTTAP